MSTSDKQPAFFVYKASAGSGKTYHLAVSYLRICIRSCERDPFIFQKILCITFTNKAVNEMKSRILSFLEKLSCPREEKDFHLMEHFTDICPQAEVSKRADALLKHILSDYSRFSVLTIDKFFQQLLNTFAFELHIPADHQLELDAGQFMQQVVDVMLSKLGYDELLTDFLLEYMSHRIDDQKKWKMDASLAKMAKELYNESAYVFLQGLQEYGLGDFKKIISQMRKEVSETDRAVMDMARSALAKVPAEADLSKDFYQGKNGFGTWLQQVAVKGMEKASEPNRYVMKSVREGKWLAANVSDYVAQAILSAAPVLQEEAEKILQKAGEASADYYLYKNLLKNMYPFALLQEFQKVVDEIRETSQQMLIGETDRYISEVVLSEDVPFIYERLGERFSYFFIDEFQDTSCLQWQNLLPLLKEGLSKEAVPGSTGEVRLFGDAKQAIYRFRNGDVRQFVRLSELDTSSEVLEEEKLLKSRFERVPLSENFRSKSEIIRFNNAWFGQMRKNSEANLRICSAYDSLEQKIPSVRDHTEGGGVRLSLVKAESGREAVFDFQCRKVEEAILASRTDGYAYADMAVLTRSNDLASRIAQYLFDHRIPVISPESLLLKQSPQVNFLVDGITFVRQPDNALARAGMLRYLSSVTACEMPADIVFSQAADRKSFTELLSAWGYPLQLDRWKYQNIYELYQSLATCFGLQSEVAEADPFVMAFGEIVWGYHENPAKNDEDFLSFWEEKKEKASLSNPEGIEAVHVMTIHKSKGLEFPVVMYPMVKRRRTYTRPRQWVKLKDPIRADNLQLNVGLLEIHSDLEKTSYADCLSEEEQMTDLDNLNVDYVAFTRAGHRLYLTDVYTDKKESGLERFFREFGEEVSGGPAEERNYAYPTSNSFSSHISRPSETEEKTKTWVPSFAFRRKEKLPPLSFAGQEKEEQEDSQRGTFVHECLAAFYHRSDAEIIVKALRRRPDCPEEDRLFVEKVLKALSEHPQSALFFGDESTEVRTEISILSTEKKLSRADRLLLKGTECVLFDFKTGVARESHKDQVRNYMRLLHQAAYKKTEAYLIYITDEASVEFVPVEEPLL